VLALLGSIMAARQRQHGVALPSGWCSAFWPGCSPAAARRLPRRSAPHPAAAPGERRRRPPLLVGVQCLQQLETAAPAQAPPGARTARSARRPPGCAPSAAAESPGCTATPGTRSWGPSRKRPRRRKHQKRRKRRRAGRASEPWRRWGCTSAAETHAKQIQVAISVADFADAAADFKPAQPTGRHGLLRET
jgi:hypothetical protein